MKKNLYKPLLPHFKTPNKFLSDQDILTLFKNGDIEAFDIFSNRYKNRLMNYVFHFLNDYKLSLKLIQDTFLRILRNRRSLIGVNDLNVKIFTITSNLMNDKQRQRKRQRILFFRKRIENVENSACNSQLKSDDLMIQIALDSLPDICREVIILRDIEGLNYSDISEITHVPIKKVKYHVNEARMKLSGYLS